MRLNYCYVNFDVIPDEKLTLKAKEIFGDIVKCAYKEKLYKTSSNNSRPIVNYNFIDIKKSSLFLEFSNNKIVRIVSGSAGYIAIMAVEKKANELLKDEE